MRVLVTGGTGFVGLHTVLALHAAGHEVRLLVRSLDKMVRVYEPHGLADLDCVRGDITDAASVDKALEGCDAVVHAAAAVSVHARDADWVLRNNLMGTELVLGGALERGIERMLQVSSTTALFRPDARRIDERSPLGEAPTGYGRSKIECDRLVRGLQDEGAPIHTTYPGSVLGPDDPGLSEAVGGLLLFLHGRSVPWTSSGFQLIDVRDLAEAHVRLLERGGPPSRYVMGGVFFSWWQLADQLEEVTGARFLRPPAPGMAIRWFGRLADMAQRVVTLDVPVSLESTTYMTQWAPSDDSAVRRDLGIVYRDPVETLRDTVEWLRETGRLWWRFPALSDDTRARSSRGTAAH